MSQLFHTSSSLFLLPLFFFFFFLVFTRSINGAKLDNQTFLNCPVYICDGVTISYPFWRQDNAASSQLQVCGYPQFGINCSTGADPIIHLPGDAYYVKSINYENNSISLVDIDAADQYCPRVRHGIDIQSLPLNFTAGLNMNLSFHFNCTEIPPFATPIPCLSHGGNESCVYVEGTETEEFDWNRYCADQVVTTVLSNAINQQVDNSLDTQFSSALTGGFVLNWGMVADCSKCEASGGRCGHKTETSQFICFCKNGTSTMVDCGGVAGGTKWKRKVIIALSSAGFTALIMCLIFFIYRRRNKRRYAHSSYTSRDISSYCSSMTDLEKPDTYHGSRIFTYNELDKATNHFDSKKELGDGGFGTVYYGKLKDGREVAVKRLYENNYKRVEQFRNEIEILAHLQHPNLVRLYGSTTHQSRELLLVYEYIPNGTVADHLHGEKHANDPTSLTWTRRLNIAIETATALAYLHASDVIHRDVKTNNILLDNNFSVKVADFGLSRLFPNNVTHVSTAPQGTPGYVDPEYHQCYQLTDKSDVYSFGVVLIELISSMPAVDITRHRHEINLSNLAINKIKDDALDELVDPSLGFSSDYKVRKMISAVAELAFQCLQNGRDMRPCMDEVVKILKGIGSDDQEQEKKQKKNEEMDFAVLLKNNPQVSSPDTVHVTWASTSSASNSSG